MNSGLYFSLIWSQRGYNLGGIIRVSKNSWRVETAFIEAFSSVYLGIGIGTRQTVKGWMYWVNIEILAAGQLIFTYVDNLHQKWGWIPDRYSPSLNILWKAREILDSDERNSFFEHLTLLKVYIFMENGMKSKT